MQTQKKVFNSVLQQRILMQKCLINANKLPTRTILNKFFAKNKECEGEWLACKRALKKQIKDL